MVQYKSNCYGFVYAGLHNSDEEFFKTREDLELGKLIHKWKIEDSLEETCDEISDVLSNTSVIELLDGEWRSQHVAFVTEYGDIFDQDWPDGDIRNGNISLETLIAEYEKKFYDHNLWDLSYRIYELHDKYVKNVEQFLFNL